MEEHDIKKFEAENDFMLSVDETKDREIERLKNELYEKSLEIFDKWEKDEYVFHSQTELVQLQKEYIGRIKSLMSG